MEATKIKEIRKSLKLNQSDFGELLGVSMRTVQSWESGERNMSEPTQIALNSILAKKSGEIENAPNGKTQRKKGEGLVAYYDTDFIGGNDIATYEADSIKPAYYMDVPEFAGCTAFRIYNDSMENLIKSGSIVFGTKVNNWRDHLEYGQIYGIVCHDNRRFIKYIKKWNENPKEYFYLVSENDFYDPWEISKSAIKNIWLIHGWLNKRV